MTSEEIPASPILAPSMESLTLARLQEETTRLQDELNALAEHLSREIAYDRQRITKLEKRGTPPCHQNRKEQLRALLIMNGGRMPQENARKVMELSKSRFSELLASMKDTVEVRRSKKDKRKNILKLI